MFIAIATTKAGRMKTDLGSFAALLLLVAVIPAGNQMYLRCNTNLVARPSHRLVLDHSQYAKMEGGRPGLFYHVNDVSVYRGREGPPLKERA